MQYTSDVNGSGFLGPGSGPGDICEDQIVEKKYRVLIFLIYLILVLDFSDLVFMIFDNYKNNFFRY